MVEQQKEASSKKKWGIGLTVTPIVVWLLIALVNGFDFSHPWLGGADLFFGLIGAVAVVIGLIFWSTATDEK